VDGAPEFHDGLDIAADTGTPAAAVCAGTVAGTGYSDTWGFTLTLDAGSGVEVFYAHLSEVLAAPGDTVERGQTVALTGDTGRVTGPHLHIGVYVNGVAADPEKFLPR
jgi:murein DD-endopeptidase MepM/ murein hydrolase activator NlpD